MNATMTERFGVAGALLVKLFGRPDDEAARFAGAGRPGPRHRRAAGDVQPHVLRVDAARGVARAGADLRARRLARGQRPHLRRHRRHARAAAHPALRPADAAVQRPGRRDERAGLVRARLRGARPRAGHRREARPGDDPGRRRRRRVPRRRLPLPERGRGVAGLAGRRGDARPHGQRAGAARHLVPRPSRGRWSRSSGRPAPASRRHRC